jgi:hypothetical protein
MHRKDLVQWVVGAAAVLALAGLLFVLGEHYFAPPSPTAPEDMPEPPLPDDVERARQAVQEGRLRDALNGLPEDAQRRRHEQRLEQLREIEARAADVGGDERATPTDETPPDD